MLLDRPKSGFPTRFIAASVLGAALLAGCQQQRFDLGQARQAIDKGDRATALVVLRGYLQAHPNDGEARYLFGAQLLAQNDPRGAVVELRKARDLHWNDDKVVPLLVRAAISLGQHAETEEEFGNVRLQDPRAQAEMLGWLAYGWAMLGVAKEATHTADAALALDPSNAIALVARGRVLAAEGKVDAALADAAKAAAGGSIDALLLTGEIQTQLRQDLPAALAAYGKALEQAPKNVQAHTGLITTLVMARDWPKADAAVKALAAAAPNHPQTFYYRSLLAFERGEYDAAREQIQRVLRVLPDNTRALYLAGRIEYARMSLLQAETHLTKALQFEPEDTSLRMYLGRTLIRSGQQEKALALLREVIQHPEGAPADLIVTAADALLLAGDSGRAMRMFATAAKADPNNVKSHTALALSKIGSGKVAEGVSELRDLAGKDAGTTADMALVATMLERKDMAGALAAIQDIEKKLPNAALPALLQGRLLNLRSDPAGARQAFELALQRDPRYMPAVFELVTLDVAAGKSGAAIERLEGVLKTEPKNIPLLLRLEALQRTVGAPPAVRLALLERAVAADPTDSPSRQALIRHHVAEGTSEQVVSATHEALAALPSEPELLAVAARAYAGAREFNQAVSAAGKLAALQPSSPRALMLLADMQFAAGVPSAARASLEKALAVTVDRQSVLERMIGVELDAHNPAGARAIAQREQKAKPNDPTGHYFIGEIEAAQNNWAAAAEAYREALKKAPASGAVAARLHNALSKAGRADEAKAMAAAFLAQKPNDGRFLAHLGDVALAAKDYAEAESRYRSMMRFHPRDSLGYNNLAWTLALQKKPEAVEVAQTAVALSRSDPRVLDTLSFALAQTGNRQRAIETQRLAVAVAPRDADLRLHLARLLLENGDKPAARAELERIVRPGVKFPGLDEAKRLLAQT